MAAGARDEHCDLDSEERAFRVCDQDECPTWNRAAGAPVDAAKENGTTPLIGAAQHGFKQVISLLVGAACDVRLAKADGVTALHRSAGNGSYNTSAMLVTCCL